MATVTSTAPGARPSAASPAWPASTGGHLAAMARVRLAVTLRELGDSAADTDGW